VDNLAAGANPAVEKKFFEELSGVLNGRAPNVEDMPKLTYTANILTESMRLYPPAWGMARLVKEEVEVAGTSWCRGTAWRARSGWCTAMRVV